MYYYYYYYYKIDLKIYLHQNLTKCFMAVSVYVCGLFLLCVYVFVCVCETMCMYSSFTRMLFPRLRQCLRWWGRTSSTVAIATVAVTTTWAALSADCATRFYRIGVRIIRIGICDDMRMLYRSIWRQKRWDIYLIKCTKLIKIKLP